MEAKVNYTVVGLSVLLLTAGLIATVLWLSVGFNQKSYKRYAVYFHEAVTGLSEESPVKFNGVQVGSVLRIQLNPKDPQQVKLTLNIEEKTPITTSTTATLISQGITGVSYVGLAASSSDLTPLKCIANEPYPIIPTKPSLFNQIDNVIKKVSDNMSKVAEKLNELLDKENLTAIKKTVTNLSSVSDVFMRGEKNIKHILTNTDRLTADLAKASQGLPKTVQKLESMATALNKAGQKIGSAMDSGKIAIDKFSDQTLPPANLLIRRLDRIAANLEQVSQSMRQNPAVIVRGQTDAAPGPGEEENK